MSRVMSGLRSFVESVFTSDDPYLSRLFKFWQCGEVKVYPYALQAEWNPLAASAVNALPSSNPVVDADTDFILKAMNFVAYPTTGSQVTPQSNPNMLLSITEKTGSQLWTDGAHHVGLWAGSTGLQGNSFILPFSRRLVGSNTLSCALTDNGGTATHCWLGLEGIKVEYLSVDRTVVWGPDYGDGA
jgi:hypothetical protein